MNKREFPKSFSSDRMQYFINGEKGGNFNVEQVIIFLLKCKEEGES